MRKNVTSVRQLATILMAGIMAVSCSKEEAETQDVATETEVITIAELKTADESEFLAEELMNIAEDSYAEDEISTFSKFNYRSDYLPDCVTVTTVVTDTTKERTLDFGEGCELPNGNILSGLLVLTYEKDMDVAQKTIKLSLEDFTFNGVAVEGGADILRMRSNGNGNPQATATVSFDATWPNGDVTSLNGSRTREWIEGFGSGFWGDNVFLITGKRTFTAKSGAVFEKEIIVPLRRETACRFAVSGVLTISRRGNMASLDFGDGNCDAKGVLTLPNGDVQEVSLRRFLKND
ncbi:Hypothetical protein I595_3624 [Croceitalea dokdonensis DOKDO 023]|uniref:Lipoprotein n=1 Tax=Croceitalea dokdonensis DOKDO 023 TaxID=1300341 RepID=A0A0P7ARE8_9FLAO|nr:hypothetical protein [Croceitalea dokdonensis]KPM30328.1 Hypothetical protein I595_3624 [Croceitalea dokdonensis DOKDO 023]